MTFDFGVSFDIQRKSSLKSITLNAPQLEYLRNLLFQSYYFPRLIFAYYAFITHQWKANELKNTK